MYALFERINKDIKPSKKHLLKNQFEVPSNINENKTRLIHTINTNDELNDKSENVLIDDNNNDMQINRDHIVFIYFDFNLTLNRDIIGPIRAINNNCEIFSNSNDCLDFLEYSYEKNFFISTSNDKELIKQAHNCSSVEAIFILNSQEQIDRNKFPKLIGIYTHIEQLVVALRNAYDWFEHTQLDFYAFEHDQIFLWYQMWREFIKPTNPQVLSNKDRLVIKAEKYYRGNKKLLESIDDFDYCYDENDILQWCFNSPFPSRFLHHALRTRHTKHIDLCRFLINRVSHVIQQPINLKTNRQFYQGLKVTTDGLEKLMKHTGKLICPKGYLTCYKSRKAALDIAQTTNYRTDLRPVLFRINCSASVPIGEIPMTGTFVFDVYTAFRVKYVNRGPVSVVKLDPADAEGRHVAYAYRMKYKSETMQTLFNQLSAVPKPPVRLPPIKRSPPPTTTTPRGASKKVSSKKLLKEENHAKQSVQYSEIDQTLAEYEHMKPRTPAVLKTMAQLYAYKKGDYNSSIKYYQEALKIEEKNGEDISDTLTQLAIAHHNRREFDLALEYHNRALNLRTSNNKPNQFEVAASLIGIANAQWGQDNLSEALKNAQQALALNESAGPENNLNLAMNLVVLANIHHKSGDDAQALSFIQRALTLLQRCVPADSLTLASVLNNMGAIQMGLGLYPAADYSFDRALRICEKTLPSGHPKRVTMELNIRRNKEIIMKNEYKSQSKF